MLRKFKFTELPNILIPESLNLSIPKSLNPGKNDFLPGCPNFATYIYQPELTFTKKMITDSHIFRLWFDEKSVLPKRKAKNEHLQVYLRKLRFKSRN